MKECPECGSVLADNEPYCENCGFDPGFDSGSWNHGGYRARQYSSGKPAEAPHSDLEDAIGCTFLIISIIFLIIALYAYFS